MTLCYHHNYATNLEKEAKTRYRDEIAVINGVDPFCLGLQTCFKNCQDYGADLPPVDASDLVSYLVLDTSFVTAN